MASKVLLLGQTVNWEGNFSKSFKFYQTLDSKSPNSNNNAQHIFFEEKGSKKVPF
jgi:hypothetical protein